LSRASSISANSGNDIFFRNEVVLGGKAC
jgi:hypothetical protein